MKRGGPAPVAGVRAEAAVASASTEELDLDALSDDEIDGLLGETVGDVEPTDSAGVRP